VDFGVVERDWEPGIMVKKSVPGRIELTHRLLDHGHSVLAGLAHLGLSHEAGGDERRSGGDAEKGKKSGDLHPEPVFPVG